jgi:hypothetical protein
MLVLAVPVLLVASVGAWILVAGRAGDVGDMFLGPGPPQLSMFHLGILRDTDSYPKQELPTYIDCSFTDARRSKTEMKRSV